MDHLLNFFITPPQRPQHRRRRCHAASSQWHFRALWLVLCLPGAVTFSLLVLAHGKFAQSDWYEVRPSNEPVTCCYMLHIFAMICVCVFVWIMPITTLSPFHIYSFFLKQEIHFHSIVSCSNITYSISTLKQTLISQIITASFSPL